MDRLRNLVNNPLHVGVATVGALVGLHLVGLLSVPVAVGVVVVGGVLVVRGL